MTGGGGIVRAGGPCRVRTRLALMWLAAGEQLAVVQRGGRSGSSAPWGSGANADGAGDGRGGSAPETEKTSGDRPRKILDVAATWKDRVPYRWGGTDEKGADCSGAVWAIYKKVGLHYPRVGSAQFPPPGGHFKQVDVPQHGDVACWPGHHMAIYGGATSGRRYLYSARGTANNPKPFGFYPESWWSKELGPAKYYRYAK
jgi:cell wall-associated NlpC family hydrolase